MNVSSCGPKEPNVSRIPEAISPRYIPQNPRSMNARGAHVRAQFFLKLGNLSHIMETVLILEIGRAYGLRFRLWLLLTSN